MSKNIQEVKNRHSERLMALPGVVSIGIGQDAQGQATLIVGLDSAHPQTRSRIPQTLDGYAVSVQNIEPPKAQ